MTNNESSIITEVTKVTEKKITELRIKELADQLQDQIHKQAFPADKFLRQNDLQEKLDVNRFTVRQVLSELTNRNVLEHIPYKGHKIRVHNVSEREEITDTRIMLELGAANQVIAVIDEVGLEKLQGYAQAFAEAVELKDHNAQLKSNYAFHAYYYSFCHNTFLCELINELREKGIRVSRSDWLNANPPAQSREEHFLMDKALRNKD